MSETTSVRHIRSGFEAPAWLSLVVCIAIAQTAGLIGLPFTDTDPGSWYDQLDKPSFTPPGWVFAPTWTLLYTLLGISLFRVWRAAPSPDRTLGIALWGTQIVLNALWTPLFFGAELPWIAGIEIAALVIAIIATMVVFARVDRPAAALMLPYLAWVTFAAVLTVTIASMN
jgi:translocator protein